MAKPKVAFYWCASCGGCEEAVLDLAEDILKIVEAVDIVLWPVALDFKRKNVEAMKDEEITVSFINGAVRTEEQEEMVKLLRKKSKIIVAFGSCAHVGGVPGLANLWDRKTIFKNSYNDVPSVNNKKDFFPKLKTIVDGKVLTLPEFYDTVYTLNQIIDVEYYLPGCAPPPDLIMNAVNAILTGNLPEKGSVLAPDKSLCDTCPRKDSKPDKLNIATVKRPYQIISDPTKCFLIEGIICLGPATRTGCGERCINANMPCRGCFGPTKKVSDIGGKMASAIASVLGLEGEEKMSEKEVENLINQIDDPTGLFYLYNLPSSLLKRKKMLK